MADNPYQAPTAQGGAGGDEVDAASIRELASGQKLVIYAILLQIIMMVVNFAAAGAAGGAGALMVLLVVIVAGIAALVMSLIGVWRIGTGLGTNVGLRVLMLVLMFVPLVSLLMLLIINGRATKALRAAGWKVGLMGATAPAA